MVDRLGDAPIEPGLHGIMNTIADVLDKFLNATSDGRKIGFILLAFPFDDHEGRCNYISNAERKDVIILLKEQLARFEGQPEISGRG